MRAILYSWVRITRLEHRIGRRAVQAEAPGAARAWLRVAPGTGAHPRRARCGIAVKPSSSPTCRSSIRTITCGTGPATPGSGCRRRPRFDGDQAGAPRYLLDELLADTGSGHNVVATVFLECGAIYRADGPVELRCVGETEFVNGVAAMSASGLYGDVRACAGIVGHADLRLGDAVEAVLAAHIAAGGGRFRGIRQSASCDADTDVLGPLPAPAGLYRDEVPRGLRACWRALGLSFDAWLLEPQLPDLIDLARAFPTRRSCSTTSARRSGMAATRQARGALPDLARQHPRAGRSRRTWS